MSHEDMRILVTCIGAVFAFLAAVMEWRNGRQHKRDSAEQAQAIRRVEMHVNGRLSELIRELSKRDK